MKISNRFAMEIVWQRRINGKTFEFIADDKEIIVREWVRVNHIASIWRHRHVIKRG
jgi:hypothetical protein